LIARKIKIISQIIGFLPNIDFFKSEDHNRQASQILNSVVFQTFKSW